MFETIAGILYQGLIAYNGKDQKKHLREFKAHMENYYAEMDKPSYEDRHLHPNLKKKHFRDDGVIDRAERGVYIIGKTYSSIKNGGKDLRSLISA